MLILPEPQFRRRRRGPARRPVTRTGPLVLVAAVYFSEGSLLRLTFDRPIDIAGLVGTAIIVDDGQFTGWQYQATGPAELIAPATMEVAVQYTVEWASPDVRLTAAADNGIVPAGGAGEPWAGVVNLLLPFP